MRKMMILNSNYTRTAVAVFILAVVIFAVAIALASCDGAQLHRAPTLDRVVENVRGSR